MHLIYILEEVSTFSHEHFYICSPKICVHIFFLHTSFTFFFTTIFHLVWTSFITHLHVGYFSMLLHQHPSISPFTINKIVYKVIHISNLIWVQQKKKKKQRKKQQCMWKSTYNFSTIFSTSVVEKKFFFSTSFIQGSVPNVHVLILVYIFNMWLRKMLCVWKVQKSIIILS